MNHQSIAAIKELNQFREKVIGNFFRNAHLEKWKWQKWYLWDGLERGHDPKMGHNDGGSREKFLNYFKKAKPIPTVLSQSIETLLEPGANVLVIGSAGGDYLCQFGSKLAEKYPQGNGKVYGIDISYPLLRSSKEKVKLLKALDLCNTADFARFSRETGLEYVLAEENPYRRGAAIYLFRPQFLKGSPERIELVNGDLLELPFKSGSMDIIFADNTLYWLSDLSGAFREINRILKMNGHFIFHKEFTGMRDYYPVSGEDGFRILPFADILEEFGFHPRVVCDYASKSGSEILVDDLKSRQAVDRNQGLSAFRVHCPKIKKEDEDKWHPGFDEGIFAITRKVSENDTCHLQGYIWQTVCNPVYDEYLLGSMVMVENKFHIVFADRDGVLYSPKGDIYKKLFMDGELI